MIDAQYAALFGYGGPNAYFPAVWFAEAMEGTEEWYPRGGPDASDSKRGREEEEKRILEELEQEEHYAARLKVVEKLYAKEPVVPQAVVEVQPPAGIVAPEVVSKTNIREEEELLLLLT